MSRPSSLPSLAFEPYTSTKVSLLFAEKRPHEEVQKWDQLWTEAISAYIRLCNTKIIQYAAENVALVAELLTLANKFGLDLYPERNLLDADFFNDVLKATLRKKAEGNEEKKQLVETLIGKIEGFLSEDPFPGWDDEKQRGYLHTLLRDLGQGTDWEQPLRDLLEAVYDDMIAVLEGERKASDLPGSEGDWTYSPWWVFAEVSPHFADETTFFAEAEEIGYKRTKRHPQGMKRPNDLFREDESGRVLLDEPPEGEEKILDAMRAAGLWR